MYMIGSLQATNLRSRPLDRDVSGPGRHGIDPAVLLPAHSEVRDLDDVVVSHEAVPRRQITVDTVVGLEVHHPGASVHAHLVQLLLGLALALLAQKVQKSAPGISSMTM